MGNFAENLNLGNRFRPPLYRYTHDRREIHDSWPVFEILECPFAMRQIFVSGLPGTTKTYAGQPKIMF